MTQERKASNIKQMTVWELEEMSEKAFSRYHGLGGFPTEKTDEVWAVYLAAQEELEFRNSLIEESF